MSNIFMQGARACLTSPCFKFLMILLTESKYKSGSLAMRIWPSYGYRFLLHLYLCGEISLPLSLGSISLEHPWGQPAADWWETSPNWQTRAETKTTQIFRLYPKHSFRFKRKYFCCHRFPNQELTLRGSFLPKVKQKIRQDAPTRPSFRCQ